MIRKLFLWSCLLASTSMLLLGVFTWSKPIAHEWQYWRADLPGYVSWKLTLQHGELEVVHSITMGTPVDKPNPFRPATSAGRDWILIRWEHVADYIDEWSYPPKTYPRTTISFSVALWPLLLFVLVYPSVTVVKLIRRRSRLRSGHCENCGYDLTGNVSGTCPECSTPVPQAARPRVHARGSE